MEWGKLCAAALAAQQAAVQQSSARQSRRHCMNLATGTSIFEMGIEKEPPGMALGFGGRCLLGMAQDGAPRDDTWGHDLMTALSTAQRMAIAFW